MQIVIDIPDEQVKKSLEESKNISEDEGVKGSVQIVMLYTNARLEFVDVERKTDFYSCEYKILPKGHGDLIDRRELKKEVYTTTEWNGDIHRIIYEASVDDVKPVVEADKEYEAEAEVITRGNCMMCGKELTEGLFLCKDCENKTNSGK